MSDLALAFKKIRQKTSVKAVNDIRIIGMAKYQSSVRNLRNGDTAFSSLDGNLLICAGDERNDPRLLPLYNGSRGIARENGLEPQGHPILGSNLSEKEIPLRH
ncbi:MAG TPA: hypothetical protein VKU02_02870, partial [Gemmataceae bacterium]|nr:hypothetical protein [Gemmataceae bacterium]